MVATSNVAKGAYPKASVGHSAKGKAHVAYVAKAPISSGKMASVPHVKLGVTHGNHSVVHAVNGN